MFIYPIYNHNWRNISTIYIYNKTSIKRNILTIKQNTQTINQIDHVIVSKEKMRLIQDVRSKRGHKCGSDHFLVQIKIKRKLITVKNKQIQKHKWDRQLLNHKEKIKKDQENIRGLEL